RRQDQRTAITLLPQTMDDRSHQAQHAPRALEFHQGRPVDVEPVEYLGMDWISGLNAPFIVTTTALWREFSLLYHVKLSECARGEIALLEHLARNRLKEAPPHDLETFLRRRGPPR